MGADKFLVLNDTSGGARAVHVAMAANREATGRGVCASSMSDVPPGATNKWADKLSARQRVTSVPLLSGTRGVWIGATVSEDDDGQQPATVDVSLAVGVGAVRCMSLPAGAMDVMLDFCKDHLPRPAHPALYRTVKQGPAHLYASMTDRDEQAELAALDGGQPDTACHKVRRASTWFLHLAHVTHRGTGNSEARLFHPLPSLH